MTAYENLIDSLRSNGSRVDETDHGNAMAQCPAHDDGRPSLHLMENHGQVLLFCHAGCTTEAILDAIGWKVADLFDNHYNTRYDYLGVDGSVQRSVFRSSLKQFRQVGNTASTDLYELPALKAAIARQEPIFFVEGEKDVHAIERQGCVATTNAQGVKNLKHADLTTLTGADVIVVVDRDDPGRAWAQEIAERLTPIAQTVKFKQARAGKDVTDHLLRGFTLNDLEEIEVTPINGHATGRRVTLVSAEAIMPRRTSWLWEYDGAGRIPARAVSIFAGREGTGKSTFAIWLTTGVTRGTLPGMHYGHPKPVLYVSVEESWPEAIIPKLIAAGADLAMVYRLSITTETDDDVTISLPSDNTMFAQALLDHPGAVVVIDPLMSVIGPRIDTHREREVRMVLDPLAQIADFTGSAIIGIAHFNKSASNDAANLITGSGAFKNVARSVFGFAADHESGERVMSQVKNSLGPSDLSIRYAITPVSIDHPVGGQIGTVKFSLEGHSDRHVSDLLGSRGSDEDREDRNAAQEWLVSFIRSRSGVVQAADAIKAGRGAGFSEQAIKDARRRCRSPRIVTGKPDMDAGWTWQIDMKLRVVPDEGGDHEGGDLGGKGGKDSVPATFATNSATFSDQSTQDADRGIVCTICGNPLPQTSIDEGFDRHPSCEE